MNAKKASSAGRPAVADVAGPASLQSAVERRAAEASLRAMLDQFAPTHLRLISTLRKALQKRLPTAHEVVYEYPNLGALVVSYSPNEHGYAGVLGIRADADGVRLYFSRGKGLPDPEKLLQGSAQARWIEVEAASALARPAIARLIDEALARNPVPFPLAGRGPVVIRSTSVRPTRRKK